jgi:hypothetical protein
MRRLATILLAAALAATATAQVRVTLSLDAGAPTKSPVARLTVAIDPDWHIASLSQPDGGPLRTTIRIADDQPYRLAGTIIAPEFRREHSDVFDVEVQTYEGRIEFVLPLRKNPNAKSPDRSQLTVEITYQACSGAHGQLPRTEKVTARLPKT